MPTARTNRLIALIERDRRRLELIGIRAAQRIGLQARLHAVAALRTGHDPRQAVRDVLLGNAGLDLPGIVTLLRDAMVASHLDGRRRTDLIAAPQMQLSRKRRLAGTAYDEALAFLQKRLLLGEGQIQSLQQTYQTEALRVTGTMATQLETAVQQAIVNTTEQGGGVREGITALREAFASEGFTPAADHTLEAVFRTQTQLSYSAGRENSLADPAIQSILVSFTYNTVGDDRVRETHAAMDGVTRPKDDPIWDTWTPPCGWNCRCAKLENYDDVKLTDVPNVQPDPGFRFNPGDVFADSIPPQAA
jgi:SPP1 gp7 family putative phage head morphogenesis protein